MGMDIVVRGKAYGEIGLNRHIFIEGDYAYLDREGIKRTASWPLAEVTKWFQFCEVYRGKTALRRFEKIKHLVKPEYHSRVESCLRQPNGEISFWP
jgi:hypothetical protein